MGEVAQLPCVICAHMGLGDTPSEVHHVGPREVRSNWLVAALCSEHHRGRTGYHGAGQRAFERMYRLTEWDLVGLTLRAYMRGR